MHVRADDDRALAAPTLDATVVEIDDEDDDDDDGVDDVVDWGASEGRLEDNSYNEGRCKCEFWKREEISESLFFVQRENERI